MKIKKHFFLPGLIIVIFLASCADKQISKSTGGVSSNKNEYQILSTLYHQQAAENDALAYQTYNMARMILDNDLKISLLSKQRAVIVDIDETVLDNSPYQAECILKGFSYPTGWKEWCAKADAEPIAGSLDFLKYAEEKGVDVYYITNRKEEVREVTRKNLDKYGFPFVDDDHLLMRTTTSSKKARRTQVAEKHRIVMLIGDNLGDFSDVYDNTSTDERFVRTDSLRAAFGTHWLILPNAMYGDWESAIYNHDNSQPDTEKAKKRKKKLKGF